MKLALSLNNVTNNLKKLFSKVNPFRNTESFNMNNDQVLNYALRYVVNSLDHDAMVSLINAGANVNAIGSDGVKSIIYKYERALAQREEDLPVQAREFFTEYREKCCLVLGELIMHDAMPKNDEEKKSILKIFKEEKGFNEFMEVVKLKLKASPPKKPPRTFEYKPTNTGSMYVEVNNMMPPKKPPRTFEYQPKNTNDDLLSKEPIYAEVYDSKVNNSLKESGHLNISKEPIYADVYDSRKESTENLPLKDSGYFSVEDKHVYEEIDHFKDDEHIYEEIDHFKKDNDLYDSGYSSVDESIYAESDVRNLKNPLYVSAEECKTQKRSVGSSQQEPIYAKVDLAAKKQKATPTKDTKTQFDDEHVYEEIDHFKKDNDLYDSGYSSVDESIYAESDVRNLKNPLYVSALSTYG
ncbi:hypothetical protein [Candidatus Wolbachia massiliensis]|uniref:hypothetical protein n=1 Tax=Candidatus Wolbachia massiliensis TaxID=1845000 RepID=UPI001CD16534|nr:hypothetical protein [Candidatus Wolbachia massiliensis]